MTGFVSSTLVTSEQLSAHVPTTSVLDALTIVERMQPISLVKVDVEGGELNVLRALLDIMPRIDNIIIETSPGWWTERHHLNRSFGADLYTSLFTTHGFKLAYSSSGQWITNARQMREFVISFGTSGYWDQQDVWIGRDGKLMQQTIKSLV